MSKRLSSRCLRLAALCFPFVLWMPAAHAQQGKWIDLAPFPEPHEEVIGQAANGKMYVFAGLVSAPIWQPVGIVYEYDPATNKWTKKKPMALPGSPSRSGRAERQDLRVWRFHGRAFRIGRVGTRQ